MSSLTGNPTADAVIGVLGGVAAILNIVGVAALVWFKTQYKKVLVEHKHELDLKIAAREAELRVTTEKEVAMLKAELERAAAERQIQFSAVYAKREELLRELHQEITAALEASLEASRTGKEAQIPGAVETIRRMHSRMEDVAIYFPEDFCARWHECVGNVGNSLLSVLHARETRTLNWQQDREEASAAFKRYWAALQEIRSSLRREIRKILGTAA